MAQHGVYSSQEKSAVESFILKTTTSIAAHEKLLNSVEERMKVVEAPIEVSTARFEAQIWELKQPIKELAGKIDELEQGKRLERERNEIGMA